MVSLAEALAQASRRREHAIAFKYFSLLWCFVEKSQTELVS
jgi:hypothetical protein